MGELSKMKIGSEAGTSDEMKWKEDTILSAVYKNYLLWVSHRPLLRIQTSHILHMKIFQCHFLSPSFQGSYVIIYELKGKFYNLSNKHIDIKI